jgi:hypothetical protein
MLTIYTINGEVYKIECSVRLCDIPTKKEWLSNYIEKEDSNYFDRKYNTSLTILDQGPPQKKYTTSGTIRVSIVYVSICNECYSSLKHKNKAQQFEEIRRMLNITE